MAALTPRIDRLQKNYLINGDMRIAQRGTSFAAIANAAYHLDRWRYTKSGAMVHTVSQGSDVPTLAQANYLFQNSMVATLTTPDTSIAAGDLCTLGQKIEGYNFANIAQKTFTLSFWVKATLPGTYCVAFLSSNGDRSYVKEYSILASNTWEKKTLVIDPSPVGGTWNYTNGAGLEVVWTIASGTTYHTTANAWQTGTFFATANQVNGVNTGATSFLITGAMISEGELQDPEFTTFAKDFESELAACQRYYEKSYDLDIFAGAINQAGAYGFRKYTASGFSGLITIPFKIKKRASGGIVITLYNPVTGASGSWRTDAGNNPSVSISISGHGSFDVSTATLNDDSRHFGHFTADVEL